MVPNNDRCGWIRYSLALALIFAGCPAASPAQTGTEAPAPEKRLFQDLLRDQKGILTSPVHAKGHDLRWLLPFAGLMAALIATDNHNAKALSSREGDDLSVSHDAANAGFGLLAGAIGVSYLSGRVGHDEFALKSGILGGEAVADSAIVVNLLKFGTNRRRPDTPGADGSFWSGGKSFPSGHAMMSWAAASVLADRYHDKPLLKFGAYGVASLVSMSRATGRNHYPSDIVAGAIVGYLIGHYVVKHRNSP